MVGSTLCLGLGWWVDSLGLFPRLEGLITYGEPHKSHLNGVAGSRRGTLRRGLSLLFLFFFVLNSSSGDWNLTGFLFLSRSLARLFSKSSAETFEAEIIKQTNKYKLIRVKLMKDKCSSFYTGKSWPKKYKPL